MTITTPPVEAYVDPTVDPDYEDNGTMPENIKAVADLVIGHRIIKAEKREIQEGEFVDEGGYNMTDLFGVWEPLVLTLDDGTEVVLRDDSDCCAYTYLESFLLNPEAVDHIITGVSTEDGYTTWHIFADMGDVLTLNVSWSSGNPFFYGYGFTIGVANLKKKA